MMNFLILFYAHLLADYPLQGDFLANMKGKNKIVLVTHAGIWTGTIALAAHFIGYDINMYDIASLFFVHAIADHCKAAQVGIYKHMDSLKGGLLLDQSIHVLQILFLIFIKTQ